MDIEDILRALAEDDDEAEAEEKNAETDDSGGIFSGIDPEMLIKALGIFEAMKAPDENERFLLALKPVLRAENRPKIDSALRFLKLFSLVEIMKKSGFFEGIF